MVKLNKLKTPGQRLWTCQQCWVHIRSRLPFTTTGGVPHIVYRESYCCDFEFSCLVLQWGAVWGGAKPSLA